MKRTIEIHRVARRNGVMRVKRESLEMEGPALGNLSVGQPSVFIGHGFAVDEQGTVMLSGGSMDGHSGGRKRKHKG